MTKFNILYVDDEPSNLRVFKDTFRRKFEVHTAISAKEGMKIMEDHHIDLILSDQRMPEMTGVEFLKYSFERYPKTNRILITGYSDLDAVENAINKAKVFQYIQKPWDETSLLKVIDDALNLHQLEEENIRQKKELQIAKEKAEENEDYIKMLFNSSSIGLALTELTGELVDVNSGYLNIIGYSIEETRKLSYWDITPEKYGEQEQEQLKRLKELGAYGPYEKEYIHKSGKLIPVRLNGKIIERKGKEYIWSSIEDISVLKEAESQLKESEERFRNIFSQSADGVLILDSKSGYADCNKAALQQLLYDTKEDLVGKKPWEISPENQPDGCKSIEKAQAVMQKCLNEGQVQFEWVHLKKNNERVWFDIVLTQITIEKRRIIHCLWRNISKTKEYQIELEKHKNHLEEMVNERTLELKEALKNLQETQTQLVQSEKMASLGVMTAGIAHEINNPLNYILGSYTGLEQCLKENHLNDEQIPFLLDALKLGVDRATQIVKGLNQFSRNRKSLDESCNLSSIIDNCLLMLNIQVKDRIEVIRNYNTEPAEVVGNVGMLHQIFINIITNSIQAIDKSGSITITTEKHKNYILTEISDTGCGIHKENLSRVSDPFFTTKDPGMGTGLGLSISYSIIKEHKGTLNIDSGVNKGTTVKIELPIK